MQEDSDYKATSTAQKLQAGCIVFSLFSPQISDDMFDVDNMEDLEEVSKILTNMCQGDIDILNIKRCHAKSCIMHYFPIIPTCTRPFLASKDDDDDDLTMI